MTAEELELQYKKKEWIAIQAGSIELAENKGKVEGRVEGIELVAINLLRSKEMSDEKIAQMTGLTLEQIAALK